MHIHRHTLVLLLSFSSIFVLNAQSGRWSLGFTGGSGIVSTRANSWDYPKNFVGFAGGLSANYSVTKRLSVLANLFYEQKRIKNTVTFSDHTGAETGQGEAKEIYRYLSLPVLASLSFGSKTKFVLNGGAYLNYLLKSTLELKSVIFSSFPNQTFIVYKNTEKKLDGGLVLGLGISQPLSQRVTFSAEFRNYFGLANLTPQGMPGTYYMNYQTLLVGLSFRLGKAS